MLTVKILYNSFHMQKIYMYISEMFCNKYDLKSSGIKEKRNIIFNKGKLKNLSIKINDYKSLIALYNHLLKGITYSSIDKENIELFKNYSSNLVERFMRDHIENLDEILYEFCLKEKFKSWGVCF
ncbi:hypothetical protein I8540_002079 [Clostridium perfringens]|nr:hypothetical protein [Clostridium perfringens]